MRHSLSARLGFALIVLLVDPGCSSNPPAGPPAGPLVKVQVGDAVVAEVDARFLSFALDTSHFVGGTFWDEQGNPQPIPPFDLTRPALRKLVAPLFPAYLRIGGTEADRVFVDLADAPAAEAPAPYRFVLDRARFQTACVFARELGLALFFTLNAGPGPRDAEGRWRSDQARALITEAVATGCPVEVWELGNEINAYPLAHDLRLNGAGYAADMAAARALVDELAPDAWLAGPSSAYWPVWGELNPVLPDFLVSGGTLVDVVTWHYYPQQSTRCPVASRPAGFEVLLDPANLDEVLSWAAQVEGHASTSAPQAQVWLGETGHAQCGGAVGLSDRFVASLWWQDELGLMARRGQRVVVRQTLVGSDYQLLDLETLEPNPDYYGSVLHKRLMGTRVLGTTVVGHEGLLRAYAHCAAGIPGGVTVLLINLDEVRDAAVVLDANLAGRQEVYLLTSSDPESQRIRLNGHTLSLDADGAPPAFDPAVPHRSPPWLTLPPLSFAFLRLPEAGLAACR